MFNNLFIYNYRCPTDFSYISLLNFIKIKKTNELINETIILIIILIKLHVLKLMITLAFLVMVYIFRLYKAYLTRISALKLIKLNVVKY